MKTLINSLQPVLILREICKISSTYHISHHYLKSIALYQLSSWLIVYSVWYIIFTYGFSRTCSVPCFSLLLQTALAVYPYIHYPHLLTVLYALGSSSMHASLGSCLCINLGFIYKKPSLARSISTAASTSVLFNLTY